jgi:hypothetical protein
VAVAPGPGGLDEVLVQVVLGVHDEDRARELVLAVRRILLAPGNPPVPLPGERNGLMGEIGDRLAIDCHHLVLDRLSRHPGAREQFVAEPGRDAGDATLKETLRLQPPASGILRRLTEPIPMREWVVPAGAGCNRQYFVLVC